MRELPGVTLACVDTVNHALALRALDRSRQRLRFGRVLLLTHAVPAHVAIPSGIEVVSIPSLVSREAYSNFVLKSLLPHVDTPHVLLIQWDGYVVNADAFEPGFLECDYIGAKWYWFDDAMRVGNGGFSLRSRKLLQALQDRRIDLVDAEDITIGRAYRPLLEREYGIRYASEAIADRFAFEAAYPIGMPFGFHGLYNFCRVMPSAELAALATHFTDAIARSIQLGQLVRNCIALAQWDAAVALARRRLAAMPDDDEAKGLLARAEAGVAAGPVIGRNAPCPCGSGRRYKQCHGAVASSTHGPAPAGTARPTAGASSSQSSSGVSAAQSAAAVPAATLAQQGLLAHQRGDLVRAEHAYRAALARNADHPLAIHYLGVIHYQRGRHADALPLLERSAALVPAEPEFHNNLGLVLAALDRNDEAIAAYRRTLQRKPDHSTAWNNLGLAEQASNRLPEAIAAFRRALAIAPGFAQAHWNLALALLAHGEYREGFREYEWRLELPELAGNEPRLPVPRWQGEDLDGKTLLVTAEQGIGDALQFIRFIALLAERNVRVVVRARDDLRALLASAAGVADTVAGGDPLPACDAEVPLLSLPHRLALDAADVGVNGRYLQSDAARRSHAALRFAGLGKKRRIGIAWAGAAHHRNDRRRSMPLQALAPLFSLPGIVWQSLQKGQASGQLGQVHEAREVIPLDVHNDFADTAALVDVLDAVVSVDTSIAHLAAALGKPVYLLLPFAPDWRWGIAGDSTHWYPTVRLFRQAALGDWASPVASLRDALMKA